MRFAPPVVANHQRRNSLGAFGRKPWQWGAMSNPCGQRDLDFGFAFYFFVFPLGLPLHCCQIALDSHLSSFAFPNNSVI